MPPRASFTWAALAPAMLGPALLAPAILGLTDIPTAARASAFPGWPEGARIERVRVEGAARVLGTGEARRLLAVAQGERPDSAAIAQGLERLVGALEAKGWLTAQIDSLRPEAPLTAPGGRVERADLAVYVSPGPRYEFGRVSLVGVETLDSARARSVLDVAAGQPFEARRLEAGIERLLDAYGERSRPLASVTVLGLERRGTRVDVELRVLEGDSLRVAEVVYEGARSTRRALLEKSVGNLVGLPYNRARLAAARERLLDLGVFRRVDEPILEPLEGGSGRVVWRVEEAQANSIDGAVGYQGDRDRVTGLVDLELGNLAGTARQVALRWEGRGEGLAEFRFRYAEPLLFGRPLRAEVDLQQTLEDTIYTRSRFSGRLVFAGWSGARIWIGGGLERTVLEEGPTERATSGATEAGIALDRLDDPLAPRRGVRAALTTATRFKREVFRPEGERRSRQAHLGLEAEAHRGLTSSTGLGLAVEGALKLSSDPVLPLYDLDPVGGALQLRGYREAEFRASRWAVARLEYSAFLGSGSRAYAFLDQGVLYRRLDPALVDSTGGALEPAGERSSTLYRPGYGVGLEAGTAAGQIGVSIGYGQGDGPLDGKLHVRLRRRF